MPAFKTLFLDLDGTLIDHFAAIHRCYSYTLPKLGLPPPTPQQVRDAIGGGLENALLNFIPEHRVKEAVGIYRAYWNETMLQDVAAMPGALEILRDCHQRGMTLVVLTNKVGPSSRLICDHLGFSPYLKATIGAGDTPWLKPDRQLSVHALNVAGGDASTALMIGDSPYDIDAGHNGGFASWVVTTGTHSEEELAHAKADRIFPDLIALARAL